MPFFLGTYVYACSVVPLYRGHTLLIVILRECLSLEDNKCQHSKSVFESPGIVIDSVILESLHFRCPSWWLY